MNIKDNNQSQKKHTGIILSPTELSGPKQMALDLLLLEKSISTKNFYMAIRFYTWDGDWVSIGKNQTELPQRWLNLAKKGNKIKSPGTLKKHYSPNIPMELNQIKASKNCAFIIFGKKYKKTKNTFNLSKKSSLDEAAKNLYKIFRKIKKLRYKKIHVVKIPNKGVGIAVNDRLKHAAN